MSERPRPLTVTEPVTITVNGVEVQAQRGDLLIDACERNGVYIPRFCYHPRMTPVGMCRMCLVEVDTGRGPALQPSCMLEVAPDMVVDTNSDRVAKAQDGVLEFLLINHPLDCPVCDKGGECPLQDQTMAYGPGESRWVEEKRHYPKPIAISQTVYLDRERCILCDRCTRFADEVAGDTLIHFMDRGANTQVNTFPDQPFSSYFSGNTVQICPVGALTATPYRFKARPWDLEQVESTCTQCSVGCRMTLQSSRNELLRHLGVDSDPVNWGWLCDKGRFGFEHVNHAERLRAPMRREHGHLEPARWNDAMAQVADALSRPDPLRVAFLGGARLTNESAWAWARVAHDVVGTPHVDAQLDDGLPPEVLGLPRATIDSACAPGSVIVVMGPDPKEELPVLFLRLKHAATQDGARIIEISPAPTGLTPYATVSLIHRPGEAASVAAALTAGDDPGGAVSEVPAGVLSQARALLSSAGDAGVTLVLGRPNLAESAGPTVDAAGLLAAGVEGLRVLPALRRANVMGAIDAGLTPGDGGLDAAGILAAAEAGRIDTLVLLGADPVSDVPDTGLAELALARVPTVIAVDTFLTASSDQAQLVLAAAGFGEVDGTTTNLEGRVSTVAAKVTPPGTARPDWQIALELARRLGAPLDALELADLTAAALGESAAGALAAGDAADGLLVVPDRPAFEAPEPTEVGANDAYGYRLVTSRTLYDQGTAIQHCPSSAGLAAPAVLRLGAEDAAGLGVVDGTVVNVIGPDSSFALAAAVDPRLPRGTVVVPHNRAGAAPGLLIDAASTVTHVRLEVGDATGGGA